MAISSWEYNHGGPVAPGTSCLEAGKTWALRTSTEGDSFLILAVPT